MPTAGAGARLAELPTDEQQLVATAVAARIDQFVAGRLCAHACISVGPSDAAIVKDDRAPVWPAGVIGAITHTRRSAAAVAAWSTDAAAARTGIGLDRETIGRVGPDIETRIASRVELDALEASHDRDASLTALFATKESFYKAQWPTRRVWVGFLDAHASVEWASDHHGTVRLEPSGSMDLDDVAWPIDADFHLTHGEVEVVLVARFR